MEHIAIRLATIQRNIEIVGAHPINRLAELLPWNWQPPATHSIAA